MEMINARQWDLSGLKIAGVLLDMDGLVLDTEKLYARFWMEAAHFYGFPMTYEQVLGMRSLNKEAGSRLLRTYFGPTVDYSLVRAKRIELMDAHVAAHGVEAKPGIGPLLDILDRYGIPRAIATSSPEDRARAHLGSLGLEHRFDRILSGHMVAKGKPEPDIYLYAAAQLGLKPEQCLALEDSPAGVESAWRAGCLPVMIPDQDQPDEKIRGKLFALAKDLTQVAELIERYG